MGKGKQTHAWLPLEVIKDKRLNKNHIKVLIALYAHKNKKNNTVWPSRESLTECCGIRPDTISTITTELVALGWLVKTGRGGFSRATRYRITLPNLSRVQETRRVNYSKHVGDTLPETSRGMPLPETSRGIELSKNNPIEVKEGNQILTGLEELDVMWGRLNG